MGSLVRVTEDPQPLQALPPQPLLSSFNERIRPLLDAVDRLRTLKVTNEGIQLPTIVVVGDQSTGKSSVLESLASISLPRGQGICTRVPLILRLQSDSSPSLTLEYSGKSITTDESSVSAAIESATRELAGDSKGVSKNPLTLVVKKPELPDLTMVDLPGITRVAVHGQPENIYEQVRDMIMDYITPEESIILNVIPANVDFSTSESIQMSKKVDKTGQRTLAVVTKADTSPEGLLEKVNNDDVGIGLGYICVRNRINDESFTEARALEADLFDTNPALSKIDKSVVGIPNLARKLVHIQACIIAKCLPNIVRQINDKLNSNVSDLEKMPRSFTSVADAMTAFMRILGSAKDSLRKIVVSGEFDEFPDDANMHCTARLAEKLNGYSDDLQRTTNADEGGLFLMEEVKVLEDSKGIWLPNFLPRSVFLTFLHRKVRGIDPTPAAFVDGVWDYLEGVVVRVVMHHSENYPQLHSMMKRAIESVISRMKKKGMERMTEMLEMEKMADYTCNPEYMSTWNTLMSYQKQFMEIVQGTTLGFTTVLKIDGFWEVDVAHMRAHKSVAQQAFDMKMRLTAYWKVVLRRVVDSVALHLLFSVYNLVNKEVEGVMVEEMMAPGGGGIERMLEEAPSVANKRERLTRSITLLKESKLVLAQIMDVIY